MKITQRIPTGKFSYIEIEQDCPVITTELMFKGIELIKKFAIVDEAAESPEVIIEDKKCKTCGSQVVERILISSKDKKPYHYIKCINNLIDKDKSTCNYIEWVTVTLKP